MKQGERRAEVYVPLKHPGDKGTDYVAVIGSIAQMFMSPIAIIVVARP